MNLSFKLKRLRIFRDTFMLVLVNENCCLCKCFTELFLLMVVSSLSYNFNRVPFVFSRLWTSLAGVHIVIKPLNKKINVIIFFLFWSVTPVMFIQTLQMWRLSKGRTGRPESIWTVLLKAHDWSSRKLTECNLSWKIVKYCILSEVSMINTAPHSTVSPQIRCIKGIKGWFTHPQICTQKFGLICFPLR